MTKSRIFLILSLGFIIGIFCRSFWEMNLFWVYFLAVVPIIFITVFYRNKIVLLAGFAILFFVGGIWLANKELAKLDEMNFPPFQNGDQGGFLNNKKFEGLAVVVKEPVSSGNYQKIVAEAGTLDVHSGYQMSAMAKVLINASKYPEYAYGDELKVNCNLKIPEKIENFDYRMYLAKDGIYYLCEKAKIEKAGENKGNRIYAAILQLKNNLEKNLSRVIPEPEAALAKGLIIGGSSQLPQKIQENFSKTGMSHIVAVSGYNVTIIAEYLIWFFILVGFWRKQAFWFAVAGIIIFVVAIGFPSSAVRAGVMGGLLLWAMKNGRLANSYNAIVFAGAVMLVINPLALRWDIGFQLSFLAALGIIISAPLWENIFFKKHKALGLSEIFFLSLSAQIFVLPIILFNFHILSLVSLAANLLVLPIIPITMLLVFLAAVCGFIFAPLSLVFAWLAYLPLRYEIWIINALAGLGWSSMQIENFGWQGIILWFVILIVLIFFFKKGVKK